MHILCSMHKAHNLRGNELKNLHKGAFKEKKTYKMCIKYIQFRSFFFFFTFLSAKCGWDRPMVEHIQNCHEVEIG